MHAMNVVVPEELEDPEVCPGKNKLLLFFLISQWCSTSLVDEPFC